MATLGRLRITRAGILFIVGVLVLGGLVTGAIFLVKNHGEAVRRDQAVQIAEQNLKNESEAASDPSTPAEGTDGAEEVIPGGPEEETGATDTTTIAATGNTAEALPQTGPGDASSIAIVAILALSVAFYVASRRAAHQG